MKIQIQMELPPSLMTMLFIGNIKQPGITWYGFVRYPLERFPTQSRLLKTLKMKILENNVGKGENAGNQHFLLFPQHFPLFPKQISFFF